MQLFFYNTRVERFRDWFGQPRILNGDILSLVWGSKYRERTNELFIGAHVFAARVVPLAKIS